MHLHVVLHIVLTYLFVEIQILGPADLKSMKLVTNIKLSMSQCVYLHSDIKEILSGKSYLLL